MRSCPDTDTPPENEISGYPQGVLSLERRDGAPVRSSYQGKKTPRPNNLNNY